MGSTAGSRASPSVRAALLDISILRSHEQIDPDLLDRTIDVIRREGRVDRPILVADHSFVILDGHHRYEALRVLGCRRIPAYVVDYFSDVVQVTTWPDAIVEEVTKEEIIQRGLKGDPFPPKTSRHRVRVPLPNRPTSLDDLM